MYKSKSLPMVNQAFGQKGRTLYHHNYSPGECNSSKEDLWPNFANHRDQGKLKEDIWNEKGEKRDGLLNN